MEKELKRIIKDCTLGNRRAQEQLFRLHSDEMFGVCKNYTDSYHEAQDVFQDGFIKIFKKIKQYKGKGSFVGWMKKIMMNTALTAYRNKSYQLQIDDDKFSNDYAKNQVIGDFSVEYLMNMVQELSPRYKMVFNLFAIDGYSHKEIAKMLSISVGTSKSNLSRARAILQNKLKENTKEERRRYGNK